MKLTIATRESRLAMWQAEHVKAQLEKLGHVRVAPEKPIGGSQAIWFDHDNGILTGGSDPRKDGCAIGY